MGRRARLSSPLLLLVTLLAWLQRNVSAQQLVSDNTLSPGPDADSVCQRRSGGYYADLTSDCSSYTLCAPGGRPFHFACPPGTRFHQQYLVCDHEYRVDCPDSPRFFALNEAIGREEPAEPAEPESREQKRIVPERTPQTRPVFANDRGGPPATPPPTLPGPERPATGRSIDSTPFSIQSPFSALSLLAQSTRTQSQPAQARVQSPFSAQSPRTQSQLSAQSTPAQSPFSASSPQAQSGSSPRAQSQPAPLRAESPRVRAPFNAPPSRASSPQAKSPFSAPSFQTESPRALPTTDAGQTLLELLRFSTRESSQRPAPAARARQAPAPVEPRSQPSDASPAVPSGVPAILTRVAALGGSAPAPAILTRVAGLGVPAAEQETPQRRPGLTQEAPLPRRTALSASTGQRQAPTVTGTFFPVRPEAPPRQQPRAGFNRVQRLNKSLSNAPARPGPARPGPALGAGRRARWPLPAAGRRRARLGSGGGGGGGWRTARRPAAGADPRCPRCLAALVTEWDNCFPCVSVLR